ncbi:MAG: antibiotic biosynthesis monooxygenase [Opitutaceae bacterium]
MEVATANGAKPPWLILDVSQRNMILEVAVLDVKPDHEAAFERDFSIASAYVSAVEGYISHELQRCVETKSRYILLVRWRTLEAHTEGFRKSAQYSEWKKMLHHYYDPFPTWSTTRRFMNPEANQ